MGFSPLCHKLGINPLQLLASQGIPAAVLRSVDLPLPHDSLPRLLNHAATLSHHPLFGFELASHQGLITFGPLGLLAAQQGTVGDSVGVIQKYLHLHSDGAQLRLESQGQSSLLYFDLTPNPTLELVQLTELSLMLGYRVLSELAPAWADQIELLFQHDLRAPIASYREFSRASLHFKQPGNALRLPTAMLTSPPYPAQPTLKQYLEEFLSQASRGHQQPLSARVSRLIHELIPLGEATLPTIAPMLGMNVRGLQRALKQSGTEFRSLMDEARFGIARSELEQNRSITDVALNLGYSELSAFSRAFKRWSGVAPQHWRQVSQVSEYSR